MQSRYYLGLVVLVLGLISVTWGNSVDGESWLYLGIFLCVVGIVFVMTSKRKKNRGELFGTTDTPVRRPAHRNRKRVRNRNDKNSGGGDKDDGDGDGGD